MSAPTPGRQDSDREILARAIDWIGQGHRPALVTVVRTWGSSPRPLGSLMLMRRDGVFCGSVSGGCVEQDLVARYVAGELSERSPTLLDYGIDRQQATRLGLPCNGRLELLVEQLASAAPLQQLLAAIRSDRVVARRVCLHTGEVSLHPRGLDTLGGGEAEFEYAPTQVQKTFGPAWRLLLIGAGHLAAYVAPMARMLNYQVLVCDPREGEQPWGLEGCQRLAGMPDDAVRAHITHARCVVLALTHDPRLDDLALLAALDSPAFYVGAIGSRRNCQARRERLGSLGLSAAQLARLHAPVGLPIGSHAPPEIALSILAEITCLRNRAARSPARAAVSAA